MPPSAAAPAVGERWRGGDIRHDLNRLLKLSGPVVLSRLAIMTMGLTDTIVVGRYSAEQLGFHALGWAPTSVILTVMIGLMTGVQVMTARVIGEGRRHLAGAVLRRGIVYGVWISLASAALLAVGGPPFLHAKRDRHRATAIAIQLRCYRGIGEAPDFVQRGDALHVFAHLGGIQRGLAFGPPEIADPADQEEQG